MSRECFSPETEGAADSQHFFDVITDIKKVIVGAPLLAGNEYGRCHRTGHVAVAVVLAAQKIVAGNVVLDAPPESRTRSVACRPSKGSATGTLS